MALDKTMNKRERTWIIIFSLLVVSLTTVPYLLGFVNQADNWVFTGFVYGVEDGNSYIAKMLQGSAGSWLFRSPYSSLSQKGVLAYLPFIMSGKLAAGEALHLQLVVLFHLLRIGAAFFAIYASYKFISLFFKEVYWRRWAIAIVTLGGGLGWFLILIGQSYWLGDLPLEWYSPEWFGFLSFYGLPHMLLARGLLLTGLTFYLSAPLNLKRSWYAGLVFFLLGLVHPLSLVSTAAIIGAHQIYIWFLSWRRKAWAIGRLWIMVAFRTLLIPTPIVIYTAIRFTTDPFLKAWTDQNLILSPNPIHILVAYGVMLIPAAFGIRKFIKVRRWTGGLILAWIAVLPALAYAPHNLQRRFPEGIWIAIVTTAALGFIEYFKEQKSLGRRIGTTALILSIPSAFLLIFGGIQVTLNPSVPIFRPAEEVEAFEWLRSQDDRNMVVLSSYETGNALPAWAPGFVVIGHGPESANLVEFRVKVSAFYAGHFSREDQLEFIDNQGIDFIFFGPEEHKLGALDLEELEYLKLAFQSGNYQIYEVSNTQGISP
jgi:hypothetical protein